MKEADRERTEHKKRSNKDKLILLLKAIFNGVIHNQWSHDEEENEVDKNQNWSDPLPENDFTNLI